MSDAEQAADSTAAPLDGVRVLELGQLIAGPFSGQLLADFGADVIKVEQPDQGDPMRGWGVVHEGKSLSWLVIARGKRCITADLHTAEGRDLILRLVAQADILVENFRPGTMERFGLGFEDLSRVNDGIIMVRVSGFGQDGPYSNRAGYGSIGEAMGGLRYLTGEPDRLPSRYGVSIGDLLAGQQAAMGALLALRARERTGRGQVVDVSIYESVLAMTEALVSDYAVGGVTRERTGATLPGVSPSNVYLTADGTMLVIAANQDTVFRRLAAAMGAPELAEDSDYATHAARGRHQGELDQLIAAWVGGLSTDEVSAALDEHSVPVGRIYRAKDMLGDPHFQARESIVAVDDPDLGPVPMQAVTPRLSRTPGRLRWAGATHGEHDAEVRAWLDESITKGTSEATPSAR